VTTQFHNWGTVHRLLVPFALQGRFPEAVNFLSVLFASLAEFFFPNNGPGALL